jgi:glycosyltransferase involved in cell wall biosynthesis
MRIVQISSYFPPHLGGQQNVAREISERLAKRGHQVEVFTSDIGCPKNKQIKSTKNLKINYLKSLEFAHTPIIPSLFFKLMKIPKDSVMHVHVAQAFVPEIVWLVSKIRGIPYVAQIHSDTRESGRLGFLLPTYKRLFLKKIFKESKKIIVLNKEYEALIKKKYNLTKNLSIIPNGISEEYFKIKKIGHKDINLIYVGRISKEKNIDVLIKSICFIKNKASLILIGDGEKMNEIKLLIKKNKIREVKLFGRKKPSEITKLYAVSDIFIIASRYEGLPLSVLEAMASGTPVVASKVIGITGLVNGVGSLIKDIKPKNFAKEIDRLIENPKLRKEMAKKGRKRAEQFKWEKIISKFEKIYYNLEI